MFKLPFQSIWERVFGSPQGSLAGEYSLNLDFALSKYLDPRVTFTRASAGTYFDSTGVLQVTPVNLLVRSEDLYESGTGVGNWVYPVGVMSANTQVAPDGTTTADTITTSGGAQSIYQSATVSASTSYTFSVYAKLGTMLASDYKIAVYNNTGASFIASDVVPSVVPNASGWSRVTYNFTTPVGCTSVRVYPFRNGSIIASCTLHLWGAQLETGSSASPYIRTEATSSGAPRFDHDPSSLVSKGLLIEEARTNLLLHSRDLTQAAWTKTDLTVTRDQVGIDGIANTACKVVVGSSLGELLQQTVTVSAGATLTYSVYAKFSVNPWIRVQLANSTGVDGCDAYFNLQTGAKGSVVARGAGTGLSSSITACSGGYYRLTVTCTPNGSYTSGRVIIVSALADNNITRAPGSTYILDAHQIEAGAFATSYIPTTTAAATRAADVASMTGTNFSSWFNASEGTFVCGFSTGDDLSSASVVNFSGADSSQNAARIRISAAGSLDAAVVTGGVAVSVPSFGTATANTRYKIASAYKVNDFAAVNLGGTVLTDTAGALPTLDRLFFHSSAGEQFGGHIASLTYYPARLSNTVLQGLSL